MKTLVTGLIVLGLIAAGAQATPVSQFPIAAGQCSQPMALAIDAAGDAWFGCASEHLLMRYSYHRAPYVTTADGKRSASAVATPVPLPPGINVSETGSFDRSGNLWLVTQSDSLVRYTPATNATRVYPVGAGSRPGGLAEGADGGIWYSAYETGKVGRLDPGTGAYVEYAFPQLFHPYRVVAGADGNLWVGSFSTWLARVSVTGQITEYDVGGAVGLAWGPDGNLWVTGSGSVTRFVPATGTVTKFPAPAMPNPRELAFAPDGTIWVGGLADIGNNTYFGRIAQVTLQGDVAMVTMPPGSGSVYSLAVRASDGQIFYADPNAGQIGVIDPAYSTPPDTTVVEFRNSILNHYFITANPEEAAGIDAGTAGPGWSRTGQTFKAWLAGPIPQASRVCRFYGTPGLGPNSHFFTISAEECAIVRTDPGWTLEGAGRFWLVPLTGACPAFTQPVYRVYNNRFAFNDSNHRYLVDAALYDAMIAQGWLAEGVVFCAPR